MSATRYAHSIKKHRIIKFPGERGQLIRPDTFTKRLRKLYASPPPRWTSAPTPSTRTKRPPAQSCKKDWIFDFNEK